MCSGSTAQRMGFGTNRWVRVRELGSSNLHLPDAFIERFLKRANHKEHKVHKEEIDLWVLCGLCGSVTMAQLLKVDRRVEPHEAGHQNRVWPRPVCGVGRVVHEAWVGVEDVVDVDSYQRAGPTNLQDFGDTHVHLIDAVPI